MVDSGRIRVAHLGTSLAHIYGGLDDPNHPPNVVLSLPISLSLSLGCTRQTVCIVNKMVYDVDFHDEGKEPLKQLFVSRSPKIKNLVQRFVLDGCKGSEAKFDSMFETYDRMIRECNETLIKLGQPTTVPKMDFAALERKFDGFEEQFFPSVKKELRVNLSPLVVWTQIR